MRMTGSTREMTPKLIESRLKRGRPTDFVRTSVLSSVIVHPLSFSLFPLLLLFPFFPSPSPCLLATSLHPSLSLISPGIPETPPKLFSGREEETKQVREFIEKHRKSGSNRVVIVLYGSPLVGKSTLAYHLVPHPPSLPLFFPPSSC